MTQLLIDTHVLVWWADKPQELQEEARLAIGSGLNQVYVSMASLWELQLKISSGKLSIPGTIATLVQRARCKPLPIKLEHIETTELLPRHHLDPFDRMLIAQARVEHLVLVTRDRMIQQYDVQTIAA